jgi:hypothetical protein
MNIDAAITWVDGDDPAHRQRLAAYLQSRGGSPPPTARPTRFNDAGELEYCVASILRYAPWLRTLHIVTADQTPALMQRLQGTRYADRIRIVDHRELFASFEQYLPTFNSRAIISALWRIEGLAEEFVYFNDDFMLLRDVQPTDFFRDGRVVLRGAWRLQSAHRWTRRIAQWWKRRRDGGIDRAGNHDAQELSARLAGFDRHYYRLFHNPYPMRRSTLRAYFDAHPDLLDSNLSHRLRSSEQFKAEGVATHLELAHHGAIVDNHLRMVQLKPRTQSERRLRGKIHQADRDRSVAFACVQSLELAPDALRADIIAWLDRRVGRLDALLG